MAGSNVATIQDILRGVRAPWGGWSERALEDALARALVAQGYTVHRQTVTADGRSRLDLWLPVVGVVIEVKTGKPKAARAARQCTRYASMPGVAAVLLVTERAVRLPDVGAPAPVHTLALAPNSGVAL